MAFIFIYIITSRDPAVIIKEFPEEIVYGPTISVFSVALVCKTPAVKLCGFEIPVEEFKNVLANEELPIVTLPETLAVPETASLASGVAVAIPTLPEASIRIPLALADH